MLSVVCWKWGALYGPEYVTRLASMLKRHLHLPFTLHCITDDAAGIETEGPNGIVNVHPMYAEHGELGRGGLRSNFRRLRIFDREMGAVFGPRILQLDLDAVITGDVTPLFDRPEPLVMVLQSNAGGRWTYNTSMVLMDAGVLHGMWAAFHAAPQQVWQMARARGWNCSDQAVVNDWVLQHKVPVASWGEGDAVQAYWRKNNKQLRPGTRIVLFYGRENVHDAAVQARSPWISAYWC